VLEEKASRYFTDFNGRFKARLAAVTPAFMPAATHELTGISSRYECRIKVEYHKDIMGLIEEGMLVAVRNFKSNPKDQRHSLMVISRVWPEHYGLKGLSEHSYYPMQFEIIQQSVKDWDTSDKSTMRFRSARYPLTTIWFSKEIMSPSTRRASPIRSSRPKRRFSTVT